MKNRLTWYGNAALGLVMGLAAIGAAAQTPQAPPGQQPPQTLPIRPPNTGGDVTVPLNNPINRNPAFRDGLPDAAPQPPDRRDSTSRPVTEPGSDRRNSTSRPVTEPGSDRRNSSSRPVTEPGSDRRNSTSRPAKPMVKKPTLPPSQARVAP